MLPSGLPYELIGQVTVAVIGLVLIGVLVLFTYGVLRYIIVKKALMKLAGLIWGVGGYDVFENKPPEWRQRLSVWLFAHARPKGNSVEESKEILAEKLIDEQ